MNRTRFSPFDILGITLGALVILIVIGSVVMIAQGRMFDFRWSLPEGRSWWDGGELSFGDTVREEKDDQVPGAFAELEVRTVAGSIEISGSSAASGFAVHSVKTAPTQAAADHVRVDIEQRGSRLVVTEKRDAGIIARSGAISFQIAIPKGVKVVEAHSVSGSVSVRDVEPGIDQTLSTVSGSVSTSRARNLDASSTSGAVRFSFEGSSLNARSVSGSIDGDIDAMEKSGSARLSTVSGSVTVNAFAGLDATVSLHTLSGRVTCDFPVTISEQKNNRLQGKIGAGSASIDAGSTSGSIAINRK
jgi:DUF4097 and DUF4098 domain-containing protein YvlB